MSTGTTFSLSTFFLCCVCILIPVSCTKTSDGPDCCEEPPNNNTEAFDRKDLLISWADELIIPSFERYVSSLETLNKLSQELVAVGTPSLDQLDSVRTAWLNSYTLWQSVSMFDIGMAETIGLRNFTNIFPTDSDKINEIAFNGESYNLELPSNFTVQGFPALDYLLFGVEDLGVTPEDVIKSESYRSFINVLTNRLLNLSEEVLDDWKIIYRDEFISNDGSSATASVDKLINDVLFYYEKFLRAGKIGIPAGNFSTNPIPESVEAFYSEIHSKDLFLTALQHVQDFINGKSFDGSIASFGLDDYLNAVDASSIGLAISEQMESAKSTGQLLSKNLSAQVVTDNEKMRATFDRLQVAVPLLKVDMLVALNIKVDFVDADGD